MKANFDIEQLSKEHQQVLGWLSERGAISPSVLLAQTTFDPQVAWGLVTELSEWGLVIMRPDPDSPDGMLMVVSPTFAPNLNAPTLKTK